MAMAITHKHLRDARDRLIDLLGFARTYPLTDLNILNEGLTTPRNSEAKIRIENSQQDVTYTLYDKRMDEPIAGYQTEGKDTDEEEPALLTTPKITEDVTYAIKACKSQESGLCAFLNQRAEIKVGLDLDMTAWIADAELLRPIANPPPEAARIIDYGQSIKVEIENEQEGVYYQVVHTKTGANGQSKEVVLTAPDPESPESPESGKGKLGLGILNQNLVIDTRSIKEDEDLIIRIRATRYDPAGGVVAETELLKTKLPLKIRPNAAVRVAVDPSIVNHDGTATIKILNSQPKTHYRLYSHSIADHEFVFDVEGEPVPPADTVLPVPEQDDIWVPRPPRTRLWLKSPEGYSESSDWKQGNAAELAFELERLRNDSLIIIQALKRHAVEDGDEPSSVQLEKAILILVRPSPAVRLTLRRHTDPNLTGTWLQVSNGEPGVFYDFSGPQDKEIGSVYFHKWAGGDEAENKGIDRLRIEVDFVVTAAESPHDPILDVSGLPPGAELRVRARRAMTRVSVDLDQTVSVPL